MFRQTIALTPLTTDAANSYFSNITGDKWDNDNSFLATLRALVAPRIKEEDSIPERVQWYSSCMYNQSGNKGRIA